LTLGSVSVPSGFVLTDGLTSVLAPGQFDSFSVRLESAAAGTKSGQISFSTNDSDENPFNFSIVGVVQSPAEISVRGLNNNLIDDGDSSPSSADGTDFGAITQGGSAVTRSFTVTNDGQQMLTLGPINLPTSFTLTDSLSSSLAPGQSDTFSIRLESSAAGTKNGQISFSTNDSDENPFNFSIVGIVQPLAPEIGLAGNGQSIFDGDSTPTAADGTDFGSVSVAGGMVSRTFTISNTGNAVLHLTGVPTISTSGPNASDFAVAVQPNSSIAANGGSTSFEIRFDPSDQGLRFATVEIFCDDSDENPFDFAIQGTGSLEQSPEIEVWGAGVPIANNDTTPDLSDFTDFGGLDVDGVAAWHRFFIFNNGDAVLNLTGDRRVVISGPNATDFSVRTQPDAAVPTGPGVSFFEIAFDPTVIGLRTAVVTIPNDDVDESPYTFAIQGTGTHITGDYNGNGVVERGDYDYWKSYYGISVLPGSRPDGNGNGVVDAADYVVWRNNLGASYLTAVAASSEARSEPIIDAVGSTTHEESQSETDEEVSLASSLGGQPQFRLQQTNTGHQMQADFRRALRSNTVSTLVARRYDLVSAWLDSQSNSGRDGFSLPAALERRADDDSPTQFDALDQAFEMWRPIRGTLTSLQKGIGNR
jgi:hypothetical protein